LTSARAAATLSAMTNDARDRTATGFGITGWVHVCERCGERMNEVKCKILCPNCGYSRDCSDP
jgi:anaerobic ribonucleoside-triphosphate reductase